MVERDDIWTSKKQDNQEGTRLWLEAAMSGDLWGGSLDGKCDGSAEAHGTEERDPRIQCLSWDDPVSDVLDHG